MSKGEEIYQAVCNAPGLSQALAELPQDEWKDLYGYLLLNYDEDDVSGDVLGMMLLDAARRVCTGGNES